MKKIIYIIPLVLFSLIGIAKEKITLSGRIINNSLDSIYIESQLRGETIIINPDGSFSKTFDIPYIGWYRFNYNKESVEIYLGKGTNLVITADAKKFNNTLNFHGFDGVENMYLLKKGEIINQFESAEKNVFKLNEIEFLSELSSVSKILNELYNKTKFQNEYFKEFEKRSIYYFEQYYLLNYEYAHAFSINDVAFVITENFPKYDQTIKLDSEADYLFSIYYNFIEHYLFNERIEKMAGKNAEFTSKYAIPEIKKIKNSYFQNRLLNSISRQISPSNPDLDYLYNELMLIINNEGWKKELTNDYIKIKSLTEGKSSPTFTFEDDKREKISLESLNGKYVYIDVWATWCGPCQYEIPFLQKLEEKCDKNKIVFVSISVDKKEDYEKWSKMVKEKSLTGIQLFSDNSWVSSFVKSYNIKSIPRFILIDPFGNIINADAPKPSNPRIKELFEKLKISN